MRTLAILMLACVGVAAQAHKQPTKKKPAVHHAAQGIAPARAHQIQDALVQAGYLKSASGHWDAATAAAMKKYQTDHHWQTRFVPDARALIALGLGPARPGSSPSPGG